MDSITELLKDGKERCFRALEEQGDLQREFQGAPGVGRLEINGNSVGVESVDGHIYEFKLEDSGVGARGGTMKLPLDEVFTAKLENSKVVFERLSLAQDSSFVLKVSNLLFVGGRGRKRVRMEAVGVVCEDDKSYPYASFISEEEKLTSVTFYDRYVHIVDGYVVSTEINTI